MKSVILKSGNTAQVDDQDYEVVLAFSWTAAVNGNTQYAYANIDGKKTSLHRFILGVNDPDIQIDHRDGDGLNCQRTNLRLATYSQNQMNSRKRQGTSSSFKGVTWDREYEKWRATIKLNGKLKHLGRYKHEVAAAISYDRAATKDFGEFANTNFPLFQPKNTPRNT